MLTSTILMPSTRAISLASSMSACTPSGMSTPTTRPAPSAFTQSAAVTVESLPPESPTTALHFGPFSSKYLRIHSARSSAVCRGFASIRHLSRLLRTAHRAPPCLPSF